MDSSLGPIRSIPTSQNTNTPVNPALVALLRCPETLRPVRVVTPAELAGFNARIAGGTLAARSGKARSTPLENALLREDGRLLFPVESGIPIMLLEEALVVD